MQTVLNIYFDNTKVGELSLNSQRNFEFQYDKDWLKSPDSFPLSIALPLSTHIYLVQYTRPFFENLLPESIIRSTIAQKFGISEKNVFGILEIIGGECAGAISLMPSDEKQTQVGSYELLNDEALENLSDELPKHPLLADRKLRLSLAGAQYKLPVFIQNNQFYLPKQGNPSSHILKTPMSRFPNTVINEFFCMTLASEIGLPIPPVFIHKSKRSLYVIERYDRQWSDKDYLKRLHQEDFCQAMSLLSEQKYESDGGPSLEKCFHLVKTHSIHPAIDIPNLLLWVIFNFTIGNADAHGKNLAFILNKEGPKLAPFYDILCTHLYPELNERYAMKIGGENRPKWIQRRHWERFSTACDIKFNLVLKTIENTIENYSDAVSKTRQKMPKLNASEEVTLNKIVDLTNKKVLQLKSIIREEPTN